MPKRTTLPELYLAPLEAKHRAAYIALANHPAIIDKVNHPKPFTAQHFDALLAETKEDTLKFSWMIIGRGTPIGTVNFSAMRSRQIFQGGYWVHPDYRGRGIATRAVRTAVQYLFDTAGAVRVQALIEPENVASRGVLERCGFTNEGLLHKFYPSRYRGLLDVYMFARAGG